MHAVQNNKNASTSNSIPLKIILLFIAINAIPSNVVVIGKSLIIVGRAQVIP